MASGGNFEEAVGLEGRKKIDDGLDADGHGLFECFLELQSNFAGSFKTVGSGAERKLFEEQEFGGAGRVLAQQRQRIRAEKFSFIGPRVFHSVSAAGESGVFAQLEGFVIGVSARRIKDQDTKGVARPAIVAKIFFEAGFFDASLFVNRNGRARGGLSGGFAQTRVIGFRAAQNGIDECGCGRAEIERGNSATVAGL